MRKHSFTLIELMLVVGLIAIAFGTCVIAIPQAFRSQLFSQSVDKVVNKISLAQEVMLDYHADIHLMLHEEDGGITCEFYAERGVPDSLLQSLNRDKKIRGIQRFYWNQEEKHRMAMPFFASENRCPYGLLTLVGHKQQSVLLTGHPGKIVLSNETKYEEKTLQAPYPEEASSPA